MREEGYRIQAWCDEIDPQSAHLPVAGTRYTHVICVPHSNSMYSLVHALWFLNTATFSSSTLSDQSLIDNSIHLSDLTFLSIIHIPCIMSSSLEQLKATGTVVVCDSGKLPASMR